MTLRRLQKTSVCNKWRIANSVLQDGALWLHNKRLSSFMFTRASFHVDNKLIAFQSHKKDIGFLLIASLPHKMYCQHKRAQEETECSG